jgi:hypothetical protein
LDSHSYYPPSNTNFRKCLFTVCLQKHEFSFIYFQQLLPMAMAIYRPTFYRPIGLHFFNQMDNNVADPVQKMNDVVRYKGDTICNPFDIDLYLRPRHRFFCYIFSDIHSTFIWPFSHHDVKFRLIKSSMAKHFSCRHDYLQHFNFVYSCGWNCIFFLAKEVGLLPLLRFDHWTLYIAFYFQYVASPRCATSLRCQ